MFAGMARHAERLVIRGRVQGVGYRWWTRREAARLGLEGWVRNRTDGSVEILVMGAGEAVGRLAEACRQGPPAAQVASVERIQAEDDGSHGFQGRASA